jgi:hypothetical protein
VHPEFLDAPDFLAGIAMPWRGYLSLAPGLAKFHDGEAAGCRCFALWQSKPEFGRDPAHSILRVYSVLAPGRVAAHAMAVPAQLKAEKPTVVPN